MGWMALVVTSSTLAMYLLFYTAYSKMNKALDPSLLIAVLTMSEGLEHTLIELNKAISLTGLTVLALAFCPGFYDMQVHLTWHAMVLLWTHSCYSAYQFYGGTHIPKLLEFPFMFKELIADDAKTRVRASPLASCFLTVAWPLSGRCSTALCSQAVGMKKLSIILGTAGQLVLSAGYWGYIGVRFLYSLRRISLYISPFLQSFDKGLVVGIGAGWVWALAPRTSIPWRSTTNGCCRFARLPTCRSSSPSSRCCGIEGCIACERII